MLTVVLWRILNVRKPAPVLRETEERRQGDTMNRREETRRHNEQERGDKERGERRPDTGEKKTKC